MRYHELLKEITEPGRISKEFDAWLKDNGYLKIGSGAKYFYRSPKSGKVLVVSQPANNNHMRQWVDFSRKNQNNPYLPKYTPIKTLTFDNPVTGEKEQYLVTFTEELRENRRGPAISAIESWGFYVEKNPGMIFSQAMKILQNNEGEEFVGDVLEQMGGYARAGDLFNTVKNVVITGKNLGYDNDLIDDNIMINNRGQLVLNDPWAYVIP
jgi:hypothetical protein